MLSLGDTITYKFKDFIIQYSRIQDGGLHQCVLGFDGMDAPLVIQKYNVNITGSYQFPGFTFTLKCELIKAL